MSKKICLVFLCILAGMIQVYGQRMESGDILFLYEESNEHLDPWISRIEKTLSEHQIPFMSSSVTELDASLLESADQILLYGAVMAFSFKEPVRDWLDSEPDLRGKEVLLLVTANRWMLEKYTRQLKERLNPTEAGIIDAISAATKEISDSEKQLLVEQAVSSL